MDWKPDRTLKKPIYKQLAEYIEQGITEGTFPPDAPLPSERGLAKELQVNRSTVVSAYDELESNGLIQRKRGSGTMISKDIWGITKRRIPSWGRYVEAGSFLPNLPVAQRIRKEAAGHQLIDLASGELSEDLFPLKTLREIVSSRSFVGKLGYDHPFGNEVLRETIARHVKKYRGIDADPSSILITSGAQQALHLVVNCLLREGDAVGLEDPSYGNSLPIFKTAGIHPYMLPIYQDGIDPEDFIAIHKMHRIRMLFLNPIFNNPTGTLLSKEKRQAILDIASEHGIPIVEDDPYSLTAFGDDDTTTLKSMDVNGNVLYISSLSKIAASGLRIGWIIGPKPVIERLSDAKQQIDFGHSIFNQWVANEFLKSDDFSVHMDRLVVQLRERRDCIRQSLDHYLGDQVAFTVPRGGIHLWCRIKKAFDENRLLEASIKRGVIYVPGSTLGTRKDFVRFTFAKEKTEQIEAGIKRFAEALQSLGI